MKNQRCTGKKVKNHTNKYGMNKLINDYLIYLNLNKIENNSKINNRTKIKIDHINSLYLGIQFH